MSWLDLKGINHDEAPKGRYGTRTMCGLGINTKLENTNSKGHVTKAWVKNDDPSTCPMCIFMGQPWAEKNYLKEASHE